MGGGLSGKRAGSRYWWGMRYTKMHGCGNDYLFVEAFEARDERVGWAELAREASDRRRGVGADGLIVLSAPTEDGAKGGAGLRMRIWNSDGSAGEMCGNGLRCAVRLAVEKGKAKEDEGGVVVVETGAGLLRARLGRDGRGVIESVRVEMGEARFGAESVGMLQGAARVVERGCEIEGRMGVLVSVGNPHFVAFVEEDVGAMDVERLGRAIERHEAFPARINVHFVNVVSRGEVRARTWERGAGMTEACGTGACAIVAAGVETGRLDADVIARMPGGALRAGYSKGHVTLEGPAEYVCEGLWYGGVAADAPTGVRVEREGVLLRSLGENDLEAMHASMQDFEAVNNMRTPPWPYAWGEASRWMERVRRMYALGEAMVCGVESGGELVGSVGLIIDRGMRRAEVGYSIFGAHRGKGHATRAARAMIAHGFEELGLERIWAEHFPSNPASGRVLEKAGMTREGEFRGHVRRFGEMRSLTVWGITRAEWMAACGSAGRRA